MKFIELLWQVRGTCICNFDGSSAMVGSTQSLEKLKFHPLRNTYFLKQVLPTLLSHFVIFANLVGEK